jgi:1-aminocyclopropane-1-carboxylate deaminase/D-cysteine desulfhydrase-like pyridoxal-dependent ACC family enzyme
MPLRQPSTHVNSECDPPLSFGLSPMRNMSGRIYYSAIIISGTLSEIIKDSIKYRKLPFIIRPGGSSALGTIGYVNAAFELKDQIDKGLIPVPDYIYVAAGTLGTSVGLMLGLKALNIPTKVISVRVVPREFCRKQPMIRLFHKTLSLIRSMEPSFPNLSIKREEIIINHDFSGKEYALFTEEGIEAIHLMNEMENITLDGTYTGKVFAALLNDLRDPVIKKKTILFWNTYNSSDFSSEIKDIDYKDLPEPFHTYF